MTMFFRKRKQIYDMCKTFATGRMVPNPKRGGDREFQYIKTANRDMIIQVQKKQLCPIDSIYQDIIF